jgi:hypothetical protein
MCENGPHKLWVVFDIEDCLLKLAVHCLDGLEGVVLEDFLADFIPQTFFGSQGGGKSSETSSGATRSRQRWLGAPSNQEDI